MSAQPVLDELDKLCTLHEHLLKLSQEKTEAIKKDDLKVLSLILTKEKKYLQTIDQTERKREELTAAFLGYQTEATISNCIDKAEGEDKTKFEELYSRLAPLLAKLQEVNSINQQLTHQALQFVSLTFDMIAPKNSETGNYGQAKKGKPQTGNRLALFNSQV
ncbi:flagellar protein FlgN [Bacillus gobiensis]|uniref:flagellar protein FlgN n=1 Tax=Bacillus gobiensis TaxID=1441095 RepID=UPI003D19F786